jgi:hypothetical protein
MKHSQPYLLEPHIYTLAEAQKLLREKGVYIVDIHTTNNCPIDSSILNATYNSMMAHADRIVNPPTAAEIQDQHSLLEELFGERSSALRENISLSSEGQRKRISEALK